jgi:hypothetical protein
VPLVSEQSKADDNENICIIQFCNLFPYNFQDFNYKFVFLPTYYSVECFVAFVVYFNGKYLTGYKNTVSEIKHWS